MGAVLVANYGSKQAKRTSTSKQEKNIRNSIMNTLEINSKFHVRTKHEQYLYDVCHKRYTILEFFGFLVNKKNDTIAGSPRKDGYVNIAINGKKYLSHRLIFLMKWGYLPQLGEHINRDPEYSAPANLREGDLSQNQGNRRANKGLKYKGVKKASNGKYTAQIGYKGKKYHLGTYNTLFMACMAYDRKAIALFGEFACCNADLHPNDFSFCEELFGSDQLIMN